MGYFKKYYLGAFKKFFTIKGRAGRKEYIWFLIFNFIATIIFSLIDLFLFDEKDGVFSLIYLLIIFFPYLAICVRRLHDLGKSAVFMLVIIFFPLIVFLFGVVLLFGDISDTFGIIFAILAALLSIYYNVYLLIFKKGDVGDNIYGSDPRIINL